MPERLPISLRRHILGVASQRQTQIDTPISRDGRGRFWVSVRLSAICVSGGGDMKSTTWCLSSRRSLLAWLVVPLLVCLIATLSAPWARAATTDTCRDFSQCRNQNLSDSGWEANFRKSFWGMDAGHNCTNYVAYRLIHNGLEATFDSSKLANGRGGAAAWKARALEQGIAVDGSPRAGDIAWWSYGHVAYVERVNLDGSVVISEDSAPGGPFAWRKVTVKAGWPTAFLHFVATNPFGALDEAKAVSPGTIYVRGWAADAQKKAGPMSVHVYSDGQYVGALTTSRPRPDIPQVFPGFGANLGYEGSIALKQRGGTKSICVSAINVGAGNRNTGLGCRGVSVPDANPFGSLDAVTVGLGSFSVRGWAADPNQKAGPLTVYVYVNGAYRGFGATHFSRPDVPKVFPGYGSFLGYNIKFTHPAGGRVEICVWGKNIGAGEFKAKLNPCRTVTVPILQDYAGHIVQWSGDTKAQKTAWYVTADLKRHWIPNAATYWCLKRKGAPGPNVLPASTLNQLPDQTGNWAKCS